MPKANTATKEVISFDQQIIDSVVKQVLTPEKVTELATKMAPAIEKQFSTAIEKFVEEMFQDNWRLAEILADDQVIRDAMLIGLRKAVGVEPKVAAMIKPAHSKRNRKRTDVLAGAAVPRGNW